MSVSLTPEQIAELNRQNGSLLVVEDTINRRDYVLIPSAAYNQVKPYLDAVIAQIEDRELVEQKPPDVIWNEDLNERRHDLIDKKYEQGLTEGETAELQELQIAAAHYRQKVAPISFALLDLIEDGLKARAAASQHAK